MKTLVLGQQGVGKTHFIVNEIIPTIESYLVLDFCDEYSRLIKDETNIYKFKQGVVGSEFKNEVIDVIDSTPEDIVLIIDSADLLRFPIGKKDKSFSWLIEALENRKYVLVFQSIWEVTDGEIYGIYDDVYCFPTHDDEFTKRNFIAWQIGKGTKVIRNKQRSLNAKK